MQSSSRSLLDDIGVITNTGATYDAHGRRIVVNGLAYGYSKELVLMRVSALFLGLLFACSAFFSTANACDNCIAKQKAQLQASRGKLQHVGGSFGSGRYEGVGFSTRSADEAIRTACYWGQKTPVGIGVARGSNGYYATVLYK